MWLVRQASSSEADWDDDDASTRTETRCAAPARPRLRCEDLRRPALGHARRGRGGGRRAGAGLAQVGRGASSGPMRAGSERAIRPGAHGDGWPRATATRWRPLMERHHRRLYPDRARRTCATPDDALDAVQETFVKAFQAAARWDPVSEVGALAVAHRGEPVDRPLPARAGAGGGPRSRCSRPPIDHDARWRADEPVAGERGVRAARSAQRIAAALRDAARAAARRLRAAPLRGAQPATRSRTRWT